MEHLNTLREVMALTFGVPEASITESTTQGDLPEWDSVGQLNLMLGVEDAFGVTVTYPALEVG